MAAPSLRLAGVPITIEPVFFVVVGLLGLVYREPLLIASWIVIAFTSVLLHEMGHAVAFKAFGSQPRVVLHGFGGATMGAGDLGPKRDIVVSLAGPLPVLVLVGLPAVALEASGIVEGETARLVLAQVVWINVGWSLLNLVPVLPLDGGAVTSSVLEIVLGPRGRRVANVVSIVVAGALALVALRFGLLFAAALCAMFVAANVSEIGRDKRRTVAADLASARLALLHGQLHAADQLAARAQRGRGLRPDDAVWARELRAWSRLWSGDAEPARAWAREVVVHPPVAGSTSAWLPDTGPSASLRAALALTDGDRRGGTTLAAWALAHDPRQGARALVALAADRAGVLDAVVGDLAHLGDPGRRALAVAREALVAAGRLEAAAWVARHESAAQARLE